MPRVENIGPEVDTWALTAHAGSSTYDLCAACYRIYTPIQLIPFLKPYNDGEPQGSEGWSGDVEHPDYEWESYKCSVCRRKLTSRDNHAKFFWAPNNT